MKYEDFIEAARNYRKTFEYFFRPKMLKDYTNKWIILTLMCVGFGMSLFAISLDSQDISKSNHSGIAIGVIAILVGGYFRSKFDRERLIEKLKNDKLIDKSEENLNGWNLRKIYLTKKHPIIIDNALSVIGEANTIEGKIKEQQDIIEKIIGFSLIESLFKTKPSNSTTIYMIGIGILGAIGGMYLDQIKDQITNFYESPLNYVAFCIIILLLLVTGIILAAMTLGIIGMMMVRYLDLHDRHLSKYARSEFKRDLLMLSKLPTPTPEHTKRIPKPGSRYK